MHIASNRGAGRGVRRRALSRAMALMAIAALLALTGLVIYALEGMASISRARPVVIFSAPTLARLAMDLAAKAGLPADIRRLGSLAAFRLIQQGNVPDLYFSVEVELAPWLQARKIVMLGSYELLLLCRGAHDLRDISHVTVALANPNTAPIGYRALAELYLLAQRGLLNIGQVQEELGVRYSSLSNGTVLIDAANMAPSGRFVMRSNIEEAAALVEQGAAECTFAYWPFILSRGYAQGYSIISLPPELRFLQDPPVPFIVKLSSGTIRVGAERAFVASFSALGDLVLRFLPQINVSAYGLLPQP
ncbi:MAG: hypothetical protein C4339_03285 [Nitrososphaerota archaeon]